ncbi:hypothetical protein NS365_18840 [Aureimonas ureilytica]|uniref:DUF1468 domain-containing protein n=1 Tax=Aureimonas ureilytica TaxID=401562 RepID=A0A175RHL6_9HYPH|nr:MULTISPECIES: tripartite tricarboxylate transporter TctB family protein [Aureimonas]KTR03240.1 hypothetical protein NS365_18840 [Aureimonas ureilytica]
MSSSADIRSRRDFFAALIFVTVALAFGLESLNYPLGSALRMGPGFIPLVLAVVLALLGVIIGFTGLRKHERIQPSPIPWKGIALVVLALVIFGEFGALLGLVPVVFVGTAIVALASARNTILSSLAIAACMSALCWLVFKIGLGITLPTFGPLFS